MGRAPPHHWLKLAARHDGIGDLHLLSEHGHVLLLDQVVTAIYLQLRLQVGRRVQVLTVLSGTASLKAKEREVHRVGKRAREREKELH